MISSTTQRDALRRCAERRKYWIHLKICPTAREDAWELCRAAVHFGGVEVHDCCFAFPNEERWLAAMESLRFRFGPEYFEASCLPSSP